jgi:Mlc titration factor MtfA (ptsG expression regulator)
MDHYGATNPAEFFAVATETFFEKAEKLREKQPELYEELKEYYRVDPAEWHVRLREQEQGEPVAPAAEPEEQKFVMPAGSPFAI